MKRLMSLLAALCLLMLCALPGVAEDNLKELDVVLDWYPNALHAFMYVAIEKGYYA